MQAEAKRATETSAGSVATSGKIAATLQCVANPPFAVERLKIFEKLKERYAEDCKSI
jgi:hypothetical protein